MWSEVSASQARRIAIRAQQLDGRSTSVLDCVQRLGFLQLDPTGVVPAQHLVHWSRIAGYRPDDLDRLLWQTKELFQWRAHLWPGEALPASADGSIGGAMTEAWATDDLLAAAVQRYAAGIPGFVLPAAYSVGRLDGDELTLGHVNDVGAVRPLPAVILASVCGYVDSSAAFSLSRGDLQEVVDRLAPAGAATHMPHPNLWTWRQLLSDAQPASKFVAYFLAGTADRLDGPGAHEFVRRAT